MHVQAGAKLQHAWFVWQFKKFYAKKLLCLKHWHLSAELSASQRDTSRRQVRYQGLGSHEQFPLHVFESSGGR
jgi:hypothetical protein